MAYSDNPEVASSYSFQIYVSSHTADSKPVKPVKQEVNSQGDQMFFLKNCPKTMKSRPNIYLLVFLYKTVLWCFLFDFMLIYNGTTHSFIFFLHKKGDKISHNLVTLSTVQ